MIKFRCPNCTQKIAVNDEGAGVTIACPNCEVSLFVRRVRDDERVQRRDGVRDSTVRGGASRDVGEQLQPKRAKVLAERVEREGNDDRVSFLYQTLFGRSPTAEENSTAGRFLGSDNSKERLIDLCHVLLNSNEFIYID